MQQAELLQHLEEYHLLLQENENRLDCLARMEARLLGSAPPKPPARWASEEAAQLIRPQPRYVRCASPAGLAPAPKMGAKGQAEGPAPGEALTLARECECYRRQLEPLLRQNRQRMQQVEQAVARLDRPLLREVLRLRYLDVGSCRLMPWRQVALRVYGDDDPAALQYIRRLHTQALEALAPLFEKPSSQDAKGML